MPVKNANKEDIQAMRDRLLEKQERRKYDMEIDQVFHMVMDKKKKASDERVSNPRERGPQRDL